MNFTISLIQAYIKKMADNQRSGGFKRFNHTMSEHRRNQYQTHAGYYPGIWSPNPNRRGDDGDEGKRPNGNLASPHYYEQLSYWDIPLELQYILIRLNTILEFLNTEGITPSTIEYNANAFTQIHRELIALKDNPGIKSKPVVYNIYWNIIDWLEILIYNLTRYYHECRIYNRYGLISWQGVIAAFLRFFYRGVNYLLVILNYLLNLRY
jgi:hypothetical protein